ncbi:MAG: endonuclease/exonuclease/phosphatase family protein, partial [Planctomycetales bacterium]|nr:endonuclease/exonuclease/phosphatase family protein [Planctomycetales bacterium]
PQAASTQRSRASLTLRFACLLLALQCHSPLSRGGDEVPLRVATFNVSLYGNHAGELTARLESGEDEQAKRLAAIIQIVDPDVLLLNEIDYDADQRAVELFNQRYLAQPQSIDGVVNPRGIHFRYRFAAPCNTGIPSGFDLNRDGRVGGEVGSDDYAADCWGYGRYPGQYGMAILSKLPIDVDKSRTFRQFRWIDMDGAALPDFASSTSPDDWYEAEALERFPLSSKSHWDVVIRTPLGELHVLASHPTPPVFDGPEDRNGLRNSDEIRFWRDYVSWTADKPAYHRDDGGLQGALAPDASFVILGDLNADPVDGDSTSAIADLLDCERVDASQAPASRGGAEQGQRQAGANAVQQGDPSTDTLDAPDDPGPGNLRVDYVLPSANLAIVRSGVFWPAGDERHARVIASRKAASSDHRMVWIDLVGKKNK